MAKGENPAKRSKRYAKELKARKNSFTGKPLTASQAGFRMGVLNERDWAKNIYKYKRKKMTNRPALETGDNRSRYEEVMRQDFPKDFISDDEWDYIEAMSHWSKK